jgi:hypothetical protein
MRFSESLRRIVDDASQPSISNGAHTIQYAGTRATIRQEPVYRNCTFDPADLIVGGSAQRTALEKLIGEAHKRIIIHSTFIQASDVEKLFDCIRAASRRGVEFSVFWGAEYDEETENRNADEAWKIMEMVGQHPDTAGRVHVDMRTMGSHAKLALVDTPSGDWIAAVSSCNWLKSPFRNVDLTVILRDQSVVADAIGAFQRIIGRRGLSDTVASELALTRRNMGATVAEEGNARIAVVSAMNTTRL